MDVYADNLVQSLRQIRPHWKITECAPHSSGNWRSGTGLRKYYERYWNHPRDVVEQSGDMFHVIDHTHAHVARWLQAQGKPVVVTCHDLVPLTHPETVQAESRLPALSAMAWRYSANGLKCADQVLCVSSHTAGDVVQHLNIPHQRTTVIHSAVNNQFRSIDPAIVHDFRQRHLANPQELVLLHVGSNQVRKNISNILKALKRVQDRGIPARLWRVGDGFTAEQTAYIEQAGLSDRITQFENIDQSKLVTLYNAADITLFPSFYEGFGFPVLESMACGTPVITSNTSSLPEVAGNAAILIDPTQPKTMADAIEWLHQDSNYRKQLIQQGSQWVKQFQWKITAEKTAQLYEQVLERYQPAYPSLVLS
ncbi:glycosyltransferase family 4 protein [Alkalinema pantanalense CENA528]